MSEIRSFKVSPADNVATMLDDAEANSVVKVFGDDSLTLKLAEHVKLGHKIALRDIRRSQAIVKFGVAVGAATADIRAGQWVHLHNCASNFDQRSQTLDVHTGAVTDTKYE
jgi:hypothetical protein